MSLDVKQWATVIFFTFCTTALRGQTIQIMLIDGNTGRPVTDRSSLHVKIGKAWENSFEIPADKDGIVRLRFTHDDSEINVPDCNAEEADWQKLQTNPSKQNTKEFNNKYKYCGNEVDHPVVRFTDSFSTGPLIRIVGGRNYFRYVPCWTDSTAHLSTEDVLQHGVATANSCGKGTVAPQPGQLILFVRPPTNREAWRQAWD
jgi:hypothetical protein